MKEGENMKKAILVVSFGTSYKEARKLCIESMEERIRENFKDYEIRRAFTSNMIIKKLMRRDGIHVDSVNDALKKINRENFDEVYVQPLHIIPGYEFNNKIINIVKKYIDYFPVIKIGKTLLYDTEDYQRVVEALEHQIPNLSGNEAVVLMGHGTEHFADFCYSIFQNTIYRNNIKNVYIASVEGMLTIENIIPILKEKEIEKVTLMPFMLVCGDHGLNDMAGDSKDSWKSILEREGFSVDTYLHGLGENEAIQDIYISHIGNMISQRYDKVLIS